MHDRAPLRLGLNVRLPLAAAAAGAMAFALLVPAPSAAKRAGKAAKVTAADGATATSTSGCLAGQCHAKLTARKAAHTAKCESCHKPRAGFSAKAHDAAAFITAGSNASCVRCHGKMLSSAKSKKKLPFVHGPVAVAACKACHAAHDVRRESVPVADANKRCFACHEADRFASRFQGQKLDKSCVSCHEAHAGDKRFLVRRETGKPCGQ